LDQKGLIKLWRESERFFRGRGKEEIKFFAIHGHWPEQACDERCDQPKVEESTQPGSDGDKE
jgi:hypothetical protein